eukprot:m.110699 g.110699  ORF g.110699 m.110699 type:complete len:81 (+) comp14048_c0_seq4:239-481(+)
MYVYYVKYYVTLPCALTELYGVSVCVLCMCVTTSDLKLYKTVNCFSYFFKLVEKARGYMLHPLVQLVQTRHNELSCYGTQ